MDCISVGWEKYWFSDVPFEKRMKSKNMTRQWWQPTAQYMHCVCVSILLGLPGLTNGCVLRRGGRAPLPLFVFSAGCLRALRHAVRRFQSVDANGQQVGTKQHLPIPLSYFLQSVYMSASLPRDLSLLACPTFTQGQRVWRHRRGGPVQPGRTADVLQPQKVQRPQFLQLHEQPGQRGQPSSTSESYHSASWIHVRSTWLTVSQHIWVISLTTFPLCHRNQSMLFGGSPRYENVPLIGRGSPPPSVRWPCGALVSLVWWGWGHRWTRQCCYTHRQHAQQLHEHDNTYTPHTAAHCQHTLKGRGGCCFACDGRLPSAGHWLKCIHLCMQRHSLLNPPEMPSISPPLWIYIFLCSLV